MPDFARYIPVDHSQQIWGFHVTDTGHTVVSADSKYPPNNHPLHYEFKSDQKRTLDEYQIIYITEGAGCFESQSKSKIEIQAGHVILLFPGEWHSYSPSKHSGWTEHWIGFNGDLASKLMENFFSPDSPVLEMGYSAELLHLIHQVYQASESSKSTNKSMMPGYTLAILSYLSNYTQKTDKQGKLEESLEKARRHIVNHFDQEINLEELANNLGISYSSFRVHFKEKTGFSPRQYQISIRINVAKELLSQTTIKINDLAMELGFQSSYYFSRIFSQKTGISPLQFRKQSSSTHSQ